MSDKLKGWPATPIAQQRQDWTGEAQDNDGSWFQIAGPGPVTHVIRDVRHWRSSRDPRDVGETRVK